MVGPAGGQLAPEEDEGGDDDSAERPTDAADCAGARQGDGFTEEEMVGIGHGDR